MCGGGGKIASDSFVNAAMRIAFNGLGLMMLENPTGYHTMPCGADAKDFRW
jgi:hypothetical protein